MANQSHGVRNKGLIMFQSAGFRFIAVGLLALFMFIPFNLVSSAINDRANYSRQTVSDISSEWGGAQQIGFRTAYLLASAATIALLTVFGATALKLGKRTETLAVMLMIVYAVLYLILQSADYALLAGSTLAFLALAGTMWLARNEGLQGRNREPRKWLRLKEPPQKASDPGSHLRQRRRRTDPPVKIGK